MKIQENEDYWFFNAGLPNEQFFDDGAGSVYISKKDGTLIPMHLWLPEVQELNSKFEENSKTIYDYYDENNGYIYRWDVQHNIGDLVSLIGGNEVFTAALDSMFDTPLGMSKWQFYSFLPDHTGNVGMFSMANEPSLHIPYLYNYAGMVQYEQVYLTENEVTREVTNPTIHGLTFSCW